MTDFEISVRGKWEKTTKNLPIAEIDAYRCSLCGGICLWKHKICTFCKGIMNVDEESEDKNEQ